MGIVWNDIFKLNPPNKDTPQRIALKHRELIEAIENRIKHEHKNGIDGTTDGSEAVDWLHKAGSAVVYIGNYGGISAFVGPTTRPDESTALSADDEGRLCFDTTDNLFYVWDGATWQLLNFGAGPRLYKATSSGSWTVPVGVKRVKITVIGGGGGGGNAEETGTTGDKGGVSGGGGGGGFAITWLNVTPGASISYTIGSGGSGGTSGGNNGSSGGTTSASYGGSTVASASGGSGGRGATGTDDNGLTFGLGGNGGVGTVGDIKGRGEAGGDGTLLFPTYPRTSVKVRSGKGGDSLYASGGLATPLRTYPDDLDIEDDGNAGAAPGGGGSGAVEAESGSGTQDSDGGSGAKGGIFIEY